MNESDPQQFEDPALKAAVRAAMGDETAPPGLRSRIEQALAGQRARSPWVIRSFVAAAAVLLIGIGLAYYYFTKEQPAPLWFADAMVVAHDLRVASPAHHLATDIAGNDLSVIRQQLVQRVGHPVLAALIGEGWKLEAAGIADVSKIPAAELFFTRGDQTLSVFSVASAALYQNSSDTEIRYSQIDKGHEIAGFVRGRAVHCLVAYDAKGNLSLGETIRLRDQLRSQLDASASN